MISLVPIVIRYIHFAEARFLGTSPLRGASVRSFILLAAATMATAQFKPVGPAPYSPTVARQKIRALLEGIDPNNRQKTIATLSGLLSWYRDILDEELVVAWQKDTRANVMEVMESLADSRVASRIVEFSWRERRQTAFNLTYAPMLGNLMARFPESSKPFLDDLLSASQTPELSQPEAETVCRILLDMPDIERGEKVLCRSCLVTVEQPKAFCFRIFMAPTRRRAIKLSAGRPISKSMALGMGTCSQTRVEGRRPPSPRRPAPMRRITSSQGRGEGRCPLCPRRQAVSPRIIRQK
jgi:hypothetical protein